MTDQLIKPLVSILTPTWNRAEYLIDVWRGLKSQSYSAIEWVVANDGSDDNTIDVVKELASKSDFAITLINASIRVGKSRIDNEAVNLAGGEFIIWCDSDDVLLPNAIEVLLKTWNSIPEKQRQLFSGVTALCQADGVVLGKEYPKDEVTDLLFNDLLYSMKSDLVIFTRADLLKQSPFLEVDYLISESSVWNQIGVRKTRFVPRVLETKNYGEKNCLSLSGKMRYNRGQAHAIALTQRHARERSSEKELMVRTINFVRLCNHGDIKFREGIRLWHENGGSILVLLALSPVGVLLAVKDRLRGKVEKTHEDFEKAIAVAVFEVQKF